MAKFSHSETPESDFCFFLLCTVYFRVRVPLSRLSSTLQSPDKSCFGLLWGHSPASGRDLSLLVSWPFGNFPHRAPKIPAPSCHQWPADIYLFICLCRGQRAHCLWPVWNEKGKNRFLYSFINNNVILNNIFWLLDVLFLCDRRASVPSLSVNWVLLPDRKIDIPLTRDVANKGQWHRV